MFFLENRRVFLVESVPAHNEQEGKNLKNNENPLAQVEAQIAQQEKQCTLWKNRCTEVGVQVPPSHAETNRYHAYASLPPSLLKSMLEKYNPA